MLIRQNYYDNRRGQIKQQVLDILASINQMLKNFDDFLCNPTAERKNSILEGEAFIDTREVIIEKYILEIISLEQLDTSEIKWLFSMSRIVRELERIGDQLTNIITISDMVDIAELRPLIRNFFHYEKEMMNWLVNGIRDEQVVNLEAVMNHDEYVNELNKENYQYIISLVNQKSNVTESKIQMVIISRFLERIGDHLVNTARIYKNTIDDAGKG
ncbi:phosphate signaling complex PhoU family protein [Gracilibacillus timonensis]|uniref:phosphate signaling complex PhoU family protein n=1 Tax=Gracilibacillus timonensis TaxID=1816696 RepID=UPI00082536E1|nr:phosphate uptake regulator PhoU [Gracilibacillus timonensis]